MGYRWTLAAIFRKLKKLTLDSRPLRIPAPIESLPVELIYLIADHLPQKSDMTCLALSTRRMYTILCREYRPLPEDDRKRMLLAIQCYVPKRYLCEECWQFHKFSKGCGPRNHFSDLYSLSSPKCRRKQTFDTWPGYNVAFFHAQLVMSRHLFGSKHGIPLSALQSSVYCKAWLGLAQLIDTQHAWTPKVIDGELYLADTHVFKLSKDATNRNARTLLSALQKSYFRICVHLFSHTLRGISPTRRIVGLHVDPNAALDPFAVSKASCGYCDLDYEVTVQAPRCVCCDPCVKIRAWRRLGQCRSAYCND